MRQPSLLVVALSLACASAPEPDIPSPATGSPPALAAAPWSAPRLASSSVPSVYAEVWRGAENRQRCALLAPRHIDGGVGAGGVARAATFSGGWAVAYDQSQLRSAFGIAGTGVSAWEAGVYDDWPHARTWADSSRAGYGPEGGDGPNWLAYLRIPGQDCLYNVWSRHGRAHLEELIDRLRFVDAR